MKKPLTDECVYAEYAIDDIFRRNKIYNILEYSPDYDGKEYYRSIFLYDEGMKEYAKNKKSVSGYSGNHIADYLHFDFDGTDLDLVKKETEKFIKHLNHNYDISYEQIEIYFSGSKGFHISIPFKLFCNPINPSADFYKIYKSLAVEITQGFDFIDSSIYESRRLFRLPNSINKKSSLYKIQLSQMELRDMSIDQIKEMAKTKRKLPKNSDQTELLVNPKLELLFNKFNFGSISALQGSKINNSNYLQFDEILQGVTEGNRNNSALKVIGLFISKGFDKNLTYSMLKLWNANNFPPLDDEELRALVSKSFDRYSKNIPNANDFVLYDLKSAGNKYQEFIKGLSQLSAKIGFESIDKKIRGISPGEICCILGKTSVGKSAFLEFVALYNAIHLNKPVLMFSLEMPVEGIFERACQAKWNMTGLEVEKLFQENILEANDKTLELHKLIPNFYCCEDSGLDLKSIEERIIWAEKEHYKEKTGLVVIDYLGLIRGQGTSIYEQSSNIAREIKNIAKRVDVPIIYLSQVSRSYDLKSALDISAARDSGAIEEASDFILGLWEDGNAEKMDFERKVKLAILKNRKGGADCETKLKMNKKNLTFSD